MTTSNVLERQQQYLAAFGDMIITWNQSENLLRFLLLTMCDETSYSHVMIAELGSVGLENALSAVSGRYDSDIQLATSHVVNAYTLLRAYRNYYAHGMSGFIYEEGVVKGFVYSVSGKGKLSVDRDIVEIETLAKLKIYITQLSLYVEGILDTINPQPGSRTRPLLPLREKFPLPDKLSKSRTNLPQHPHRPRASDASV